MIKSISSIFLLIFLITNAIHAQSDNIFSTKKYVCPPCYHVENVFETKSFHEDGKCPICGMELIEQPSFEKESSSTIHFGSGNFNFKSNRPRASSITVFYHKPKQYGPDSRILIVVPGAGRNAWDYRDSWVDVSEKYNVLVVSPFYPENEHDIAAYHLAGVITSIEFRNYTVSKIDDRVNKYHMADKDLVTGEKARPDAWLFRDFDDIFDKVVQLSQSNRKNYDIFGHSAGGQILHRLAILYPTEKIDRIIASNSGSYTLPSFDSDYPFGLKDIEFRKGSFKQIFSRRLTLLVGELDNDSEQRGTMLHTPSLDKQGLGRLSRAQSFYNKSRKSAKESGGEFEWDFCTVEGVGHDHINMGKAAAELLYADRKCTLNSIRRNNTQREAL